MPRLPHRPHDATVRAFRRTIVLALVGFCLAEAPASADAVADFYRGKRLMLVVATPPGGPYDICARLLARHLSVHVPGRPSIVVENMTGATGVVAAKYLYDRAPQDGTVLANLHNMLPLLKMLGRVPVDLDPARLNWIGNMTRETGDVVVSAKTEVRTIDDARRIQVLMGAATAMAAAGIYPKVMNAVLGTRFRLVTGYDGFAAVMQALERGEVEGNAGDTWYGTGTTFDLYRRGAIRVLVQIGAPSPDLGSVPLLVDLAANDGDRDLLELFSSPYALGKPTAMGPEVPPERVQALREAYQATMADPAFLADAKRLGVPIAPVPGPELEALVQRLATLPPALVARARAAVAE